MKNTRNISWRHTLIESVLILNAHVCETHLYKDTITFCIHVDISHIIIIICDISIASYSARSCSKVLYNIILLDSRPVSTQHISPKEAYNTCCHNRCKVLLKHIAIASCRVLIFYGWVNQSPHDIIVLTEPRTHDVRLRVLCSN